MTNTSTSTKLPCTQLGCSYPSQLLLGHSHSNNCCDSLRQIQESSVPSPHSVCPCVLQHRVPVNFLTRGPCSADQTYLLGSDPSAFYSPLNRASCADLKDPIQPWRESPWQLLVQQPHRFPYESHSFDPHSHPACARFNPIDLAAAGARRKNATRETTSTLKAWLYEHRKNPYPTKGEKIMLAIITKMTLTQVSTWFANARRRLKKENKMTWSPRNRCGERKDSENSDDNDPLDNLDIDDEDENGEKANFLEQDDERLDVEVDRDDNDENDEHMDLRTTNEHSQERERALHHHHNRTKSPWNPESVPRTSEHATASIEDSPVKSLRKWVDGCFHDSPSNHQTATDTPPSTPPATETSNTTAHSQTTEEKIERVYAEVVPEVKAERPTAFKPVERRRSNELKDYREFDAALALTTLSSR